jgi:hypothetical protein
VIARGVFTSVKDLARKLMRYIRHYNRAPKPIKWTYRDPTIASALIPLHLLQATSCAKARAASMNISSVTRFARVL